MSDDTFAECRDFFDVLDDRLTFKGFLQVSFILSRLDLDQTDLRLFSALSITGRSLSRQSCRAVTDVVDVRQTENDPSETLNDLKSWGYDLETLELNSQAGPDDADDDEEEKDVKGKSSETKVGESSKAGSSSEA